MLEILHGHHPDDPVVFYQHGVLTRRQFAALVHDVADRIATCKPGAGDRVLLALPNSLELLTAYYACLVSGWVAVPVNERLARPEVRRIIGHSNPAVICTKEDRYQRHLIDGREPGIPCLVLDNLQVQDIQAVDSPVPVNEWPGDHPAIIFYTSGSTGVPKGAVYTHRTLRENSRIYREQFGLGRTDRSVLVHCMAHNFVFTQTTVPFLDAGGSVHVVDFGSVEQTVAALESGASFLSLIPWFGFELFDYCKEHRPEFDALRVCLFGGDRVPEDIIGDCPDVLGVPASQNIGMTETNTYAVHVGREGMDMPLSAGRALPDVQIQIRTPEGEICGPGMRGEIWVATPARMQRYWNDEVRTREVMENGWIATGDAGHIDEDGYLWFDARIRNIIIRDGDNIYPSEVEREIARHPSVRECVVAGIPDARHGETVATVLVLNGDTIQLQELQSFLRPRLSEPKIPGRMLILENLPKTKAGKVDRNSIGSLLSGYES